MGFAHEGHHVVLAEGVELDVLDDDHLLVVLVEHGAAENLLGLEVVAVGEEEHGLGDALGTFQQSLTLGVFAQELEDGFVVLGHLADTCFVVFVYFLIS